MAKPSLVERLRRSLDGLRGRSNDPEREREWEEREAAIEIEREESVNSPIEGVRGAQPYDYTERDEH